MKFFGNAVNLL